uniref:Uncharacterized protein n=1 Tax=Peronospora matthiolae TaxID=2874970 RepID=A0AAV1T5K4_9STRA
MISQRMRSDSVGIYVPTNSSDMFSFGVETAKKSVRAWTRI